MSWERLIILCVIGECSIWIVVVWQESKCSSNVYGENLIGREDERSSASLQRKVHARPNSGAAAEGGGAKKDISTRYIMKAMLDFIWPKTGKQVKIRVLIALGLLLISKVTSLSSSGSPHLSLSLLAVEHQCSIHV